MSCDLARGVLHGYLDGELDAARAAEFESHLEHCPQCVAELEAQELLTSSIRQNRLYERAPIVLREKILSQVNVSTVAPRPARATQWQWLAAAACFLVLLYAGWRILPMLRGSDRTAALAAELVDDHIRSLQPGHLNDVVSSDQHTVKPWFDGKLEFSPPVRDFSEQGFPLQGGRLDILDGHAIAALVYGRRKHEINVFVRPNNSANREVRAGSLQGYNWLHWNNGTFEMWATSDASAGDLDELRRLLETQ